MIPVTVASAGEQPGTFRKMVLVEPEREQPAAIWKTPERDNEPTQAPNAPKRPRLALDVEGSPVNKYPDGAVPLASSTPQRHPIYSLAAPATATTPPGKRKDGGEWTKMIDEYGNDGDVTTVTQVAVDGRADRCIAPDIPVKQRGRYNRLLSYLKAFEDEKKKPPISPSAYGELETDKVVRGTSYVDVLRALFISTRFQTAGLCDAVAALRKAGMSVELLGSRNAIDLFNLGGHTVRTQSGSGRSSKAAPPGRVPHVLRVYK
jgi:hypothetical protein